MNKVNAVIAVAGWEERFLLGLQSDIAARSPSAVILLVFEEFASMTLRNRNALAKVCEQAGIDLHEASLRRQPKEVWGTIQETLSNATLAGKHVLLDISTMPREVIWWSLNFLQRIGCSLEYVYHRPQAYSSDWLTRDTGEPRLVYQCSGIARLGLPTGLLLLSGFDLDRTKRIIQYFEPTIVLLGIQGGSQFHNDLKNIDPAREMSERMTLVRPFDFDAYSDDQGFAILIDVVRPHLLTHNIIAASLGPKVSGIALYRLHTAYPEVGLAYAPSRQFNQEYSLGIGAASFGQITFPQQEIDSLGNQQASEL